MDPASTSVFDPPFVVHDPVRRTSPFVFNAPHSGHIYPDAFLRASRLDPLALRRSEDAYVDRLFEGILEFGAPLMVARFPRAYLDLNREPYELDARMFDMPLPGFVNTRSMRVAGGLGTIPRVVGDGQDIYRTKLDVSEAMHRIETLYKPYHRTLRLLMEETLYDFGAAVLIDCHSMPSCSLTREHEARADIVLGDRYGTSCAPMLIDRTEMELLRLGFSVARNKPYAGGYITEHYGTPVQGLHALQVEINRALYMNERTLEPLDGFPKIAAGLCTAFRNIMDMPIYDLSPQRYAAE